MKETVNKRWKNAIFLFISLSFLFFRVWLSCFRTLFRVYEWEKTRYEEVVSLRICSPFPPWVIFAFPLCIDVFLRFFCQKTKEKKTKIADEMSCFKLFKLFQVVFQVVFQVMFQVVFQVASSFDLQEAVKSRQTSPVRGTSTETHRKTTPKKNVDIYSAISWLWHPPAGKFIHNSPKNMSTIQTHTKLTKN